MTSTGESGFVTEGTASEAGHLEDRAGKYQASIDSELNFVFRVI